MLTYLECDHCGQIEPSSGWLSSPNGQKCRHCAVVGRASEWPSAEVRQLLDTTTKYDENTAEYALIASVFLSAALELMLERLIFKVGMEDLSYDDGAHLVDLLLDTNQGRARRLRLYARLGYGSFRKEAEEVGYQQFLVHWDQVAEIRNKAVHGGLKDQVPIERPLLEATISEALGVFSQLHNKYNEKGLIYQSVVGSKEQHLADLEKLRRWTQGPNSDLDADDVT